MRFRRGDRIWLGPKDEACLAGWWTFDGESFIGPCYRCGRRLGRCRCGTRKTPPVHEKRDALFLIQQLMPEFATNREAISEQLLASGAWR